MTQQGSYGIATRKMTRRQDNITLGDIFEKDEQDVPKYFNYKLRCQSGLKYQIPDHQRHHSWKRPAKQLLVDTVFKNYPMSGFVVSEHCENGHIYFDFEDGQSRMSILQEFYNGEFSYETDNGASVKFTDLPNSIQRQFENYKIYIEVMSDFDDDCKYEVFERLQYGEPLKDKDLYWNRREYPYVQKALEFIRKPNWLGMYMNTNQGITDTDRTSLPAVVTFLYAITQYKRIRDSEPNQTKRKSMWKSFRAQVTILKENISSHDENRINNFIEYLNHIINEVYRQYPRQPRERVGTWNNFAKQTGMILHEWLESEHQSEEIKLANQKKWIEMIILDRKSSDFMFKGKKTMWNGMNTSHKQNTDDAAISSRLERVNSFYNNKQQIAQQHGIIYWSEPDGGDGW